MNRLFTIKISLILFFVTVCQLSLKAQNNATIIVPDKQDTIHITLVVTPGANGSKSTISVAASETGSKPAAAPVKKAPVVTPLPAATVPAKTVTTTVTPVKTAPATQITPAVPVKAPLKPTFVTGNSAPTVAEKSGTPTYMTRPLPAKAATPASVAAGNTAVTNKNLSTAPVTPVKTNNLSATPKPAANATTGGISTPGLPVKATGTSATGTIVPAKTTTTPLATTAKPVKKDSVKKDAAKKVAPAKKDITNSDTLIHKRGKIAFLEIGGPGLAFTLNYDVRFKPKHDGWGVRVGAGYYGTTGNNVFTIPIQINYLYGKGSNYFELGMGTTFLNSNGSTYGSKHFIFDSVTGFIGTATLGYRYEPESSKFNFRIGFTPLFSDEGLTPAGGVSFGYTFK